MRLIRPLLATLLLALTLSGCSSFSAAMKASPSLANATGFASIPLSDLEDRYANEESEFMEVNGYRIHYRDIGEGETIILLHGIFSSLQTWDSWVDELSRTHRVIALDMPGFGLTGAPENPDNFDEASIVNTFAKFVERLDLDTFTLAGNSLGGFVAASYASQYGDRVDNLILVDPFGYPQDTPWPLSLGTSFPIQLMGKVVQPPLVATLGLRYAYGDPDRMQDKDVYRYVRMAQRPGAKGVYLKTLNLVEQRTENETPLPFYRINAPTLLMWGEDDLLVPMAMAKPWLTDIPRARIVTYEGVGHIPMEEFPEKTVADAQRFLTEGLAPFSKTLEAASPVGRDE
jgi:pimeloyl-ACP methyl ester carboxylesterase